jgi:hypothetical protein
VKDPLDLVNPLHGLTTVEQPAGDPDALLREAGRLRATGDVLAGLAQQLGDLREHLLDGGVWSSPAALVFELVANEAAGELQHVATCHREASTALTTYAHVLAEAAAQARSAQVRVDDVQADLRRMVEHPNFYSLEAAITDVRRAHADSDAALAHVHMAAARAAAELELLAARLPLPAPANHASARKPTLQRPPWQPSPETLRTWLGDELGVDVELGPNGRLRLGAVNLSTAGRSGKPSTSNTAGLLILLALAAAFVATQLPHGGDGTGGDGGNAGDNIATARTYQDWRKRLADNVRFWGLGPAANPPPSPPPTPQPNPKTYYNYEWTREQMRLQARARATAERLGVNPQRFEELAYDPDNSGLTIQSVDNEAPAAVQVEKQGLSGLQRAPAGQGDFVDVAGNTWDVKTPDASSTFADARGTKFLNDEVSSDIMRNRDVIFNTKNLSPAALRHLQDEVVARGWSSRVIFVTA